MISNGERQGKGGRRGLTKTRDVEGQKMEREERRRVGGKR